MPDRDLSHDSCLNPCLSHVWVENNTYQGKRLWTGDSNQWTGTLWTLYIVLNILYAVNYIYPKSLSMPHLRALSIILNTVDRNISHDFCLNPCFCHVWVENYAYQKKRLWRGDSNPWTASLLTLYIIFNILPTINYMWLMFLSMSKYRSLSIVINTLYTVIYYLS